MRRRLYDRGTAKDQVVRQQLTDTKIDVSRNWGNPPLEAEEKPASESIPVAPTASVVETEESPKKRRYRSIILIGSLVVFVVVAVVSSLYIYMGGNQISSDNITVSIQGPQFIGGGETMSLQILVSNGNSVPIESATLILRYPDGTRSIGDSPRNLYEERIPIDGIIVGELQTVPVNVTIFGEENSEKKIEATIEYRVGGSSGMFYKEADPLAFKVSSSPLVLRVDNIQKVSSGQKIEVTLTAVSNASTPLTDIIVSASYPNGFNFESSTPEPVFGQSVWKIDELRPEDKQTIKLVGIINGLTDEEFRINFTAGPPDSSNPYLVGAKLAEGKADFLVERPFIDIAVSIDGDMDREVIVDEGKDSIVNLEITNTLDETVYDMTVEVVPEGNALAENSIRGSQGFYDSNTGTVRWEVSNNSNFDRVLPGDSRRLGFTVSPGPTRTTASYDLVVNVYARRVAETSAQETLIGSVRAEVKYSASVALGSQVGIDSGPHPPEVGKVTTYNLVVVAEAGANDITSGRVDMSLPLYVEWLNEYDSDGTIVYNAVSKQIQWEMGDIESGKRKEFVFKIAIQPSVSQFKLTPVLLNSQTMRANDRFTGALLQDLSPAVTTELSLEMGYQRGNGGVIR